MKKIIAVFLAFALMGSPYIAKADQQDKPIPPTLAILDTALDTSIPEIKSRVIEEVCILDWPSCPNGTSFMVGKGASVLPNKIISNNNFNHGTQMASVAIDNNPNMNILFIRIIGHTPSGARQSTGSLTIVNALEWVYKNRDKYNIVAVSASQGNHNVIKKNSNNYCPYTATNIIIERLFLENIPVFFPSGNNKDSKRIDWPACISSSIAVGGTNYSGASSISNYDENLVDIWAPMSATVTLPGGLKSVSNGTSISNQIVAANYVKLKTINFNLTSKELIQIIKSTANYVDNNLNQKIFSLNVSGAIYRIRTDMMKLSDKDFLEKTKSQFEINSFSDLYKNKKYIRQIAWEKASMTIDKNNDKNKEFEVFIGPNTELYFKDYVTPISIVSRMFPNDLEPSKVIIISYSFKDLEWAESLAKVILSKSDYDRFQRIEKDKLISGNCKLFTLTCNGSKQLTTSEKIAIIFQGVPRDLSNFYMIEKTKYTTGYQYAHEYFHAIQRVPIMGKSEVWPHAWFREGSANWVGNVAVNYKNFQSYKEFMELDCFLLCLNLSESDIKEFFEEANGNYIPKKFDNGLNYSIGSHAIEALVALRGYESIIEMYKQMSNKINFAEAFKNVYGVEWTYAIPILSKIVYENLKLGDINE